MPEPIVRTASPHQATSFMASEPHPSPDVMRWIGTLTRPTSVAEIEAAVSQVAARHEALRTTFTCDGANVLQVAWPPRQLRAAVDDDINALIAHVCRPLRLSEEMPLRFGVGHDRGRQVLVLAIHHAVSDGRSFGVVLSDLDRALAGLPLPSADETAQVADFTRWELELAARTDLTKWREHLDGVGVLLPDGSRPPASPEATIETSPVPFPPQLSGPMVRSRAGELGVHHICLMVASALHATGPLLPERVLVGLMHANRRNPAFTETVGFLADRLMVVVDTRGAPGLDVLVKRVADGLQFAFENPAPAAALQSILRLPAGGPQYGLCVNHVRSWPPATEYLRLEPAHEWQLPDASSWGRRRWTDVAGQISLDSHEGDQGRLVGTLSVDSLALGSAVGPSAAAAIAETLHELCVATGGGRRA